MNLYAEIIDLKRPVSKKRVPMSIANRAAQFAPFSALCDYKEACREVERLTDEKKVLCDGVKYEINEKLNFIKDNIKNIGNITITYFVKDKNKNGGSYRKTIGRIKKVDTAKLLICMIDGTAILFNDICSIDSEIFNCLEI